MFARIQFAFEPINVFKNYYKGYKEHINNKIEKIECVKIFYDALGYNDIPVGFLDHAISQIACFIFKVRLLIKGHL